MAYLFTISLVLPIFSTPGPGLPKNISCLVTSLEQMYPWILNMSRKPNFLSQIDLTFLTLSNSLYFVSHTKTDSINRAINQPNQLSFIILIEGYALKSGTCTKNESEQCTDICTVIRPWHYTELKFTRYWCKKICYVKRFTVPFKLFPFSKSLFVWETTSY